MNLMINLCLLLVFHILIILHKNLYQDKSLNDDMCKNIYKFFPK